MKKRHPRLTYANVMSTLCFFLLLSGGAAYAATQLKKNSVGTNQIKKNAVTTAKLKKAAVTGAKIKLSSVGTVPSAAVANSLAPVEAVHEVGSAGQPSFENGSKNEVGSGVALAPIGFYKDHEGIVHLEGVAVGGKKSAAAFSSIFTLPPGFRPAPGVLQLGGSAGTLALVAGTNASLGGDALSGNVLGLEEEVTSLNGISFLAQG